MFKGYFTFFDDSGEWLQMDKVGHFYASFQVSRWFIQLLKWQGIDQAAARKVGVWGGLLYVTPIEILDGFSIGYGFSWFDVLANALGCLFLYMQLKGWGQLRWLPKFSFAPTAMAPLHSELLGNHWLSQLIKDYNGQTYWISFSPNEWLGKKVFPSWLLLSVGYGVDNLAGGHDNAWQSQGRQFDYSHLTRCRQLYVSLDISLQAYEFKHPVARFVRLATSCLKVPFPAIGFDADKGLHIKWLGF